MNWIESIINDIKNIKISRKSIKEFGIVIAIFALLVGTFFYYKKDDPIMFKWMAISGLIFLAISFIFPFLLSPLYRVWMSIAFVLGGIISRIILVFLFFFVLTPIGFLLKIIRKDLLNQKFDPTSQNSYWIKKDLSNYSKEQYKKMF